MYDFIGFDTTYRMGVAYAGTNDAGGSGGHPVNPAETGNVVASISFVNLPGDIGTKYVPAGSFMYFNDDQSALGRPKFANEFDNYMKSTFRGGIHLKNDFEGKGAQTNGNLCGANCNYVFCGDPGDTTQWSECNCYNSPGNRQFVLASNDFNINAGGAQSVTLALVITNPDSILGCPFANFDSIKVVADTAWNVYRNPPPGGVKNIATVNAKIIVYPNPANDLIYIEPENKGEQLLGVTLYNLLGEKMEVYITHEQSKTTLNLAGLPNGIYVVNIATVQGVKRVCVCKN